MSEDLWVSHLGRVPYAEALALQLELRARRQAGEIPDVLLCLEHPPVYTLGRRSAADDLPMGEDWYRAQGIEVERTDRGGKLTYHGPGQLVGYPIMEVTDVVAYVRTIERALVHALDDEELRARVRTEDGPDFTGVWIEDRKVASIGVHVQKGVTTHGWAVNVENDLQPFEWVVPCGLQHVRMTSVRKENGTAGLPCFRKRAAYRFAQAFGRRQRLVPAARLLGSAEPLAAAAGS